VRAIGQAAADLGYTHLAAYDHVLGGDVAVLGDLGGPYTIDARSANRSLMFAYPRRLHRPGLRHVDPHRAAAADRTGWPSRRPRSTCSAAGVSGSGSDRLEQARIRRARHAVRGAEPAILEEQVAVLRALWTEWSVTVDGRYHTSGVRDRPATGAATDPYLDRRPCPGALRRVGAHRRRLVPHGRPGAGLDAALEHIREGAAEVGRDLSNLPVRGQAGVLGTRPRHDREHARPGRPAGASQPVA